MSDTKQNMGIKDSKAAESPPALSPKVAPAIGGVTAPGVSSATLSDTNSKAKAGVVWTRWIRDTRTLQRRLRRDGYRMLVNVKIAPAKQQRKAVSP